MTDLAVTLPSGSASRRAAWCGAWLLLASAVLAVCGASVGSTGFDSVLRMHGDPVAWQIVWDIRLPRTLGAWLAGALRPGLNDIEVQHLRTHPPSGDWRPVKGGPSELVAAFSVPIPGFPIARGRALVASKVLGLSRDGCRGRGGLRHGRRPGRCRHPRRQGARGPHGLFHPLSQRG